MSTRWLVEVVCDRCEMVSGPVEANRGNYGRTLTALRQWLESRGWTSQTLGGPVPHRDWCPDCTQGRA